jgi:hypothetical protein
MTMPKTGDQMNSNDRIFSWAKLLSPFAVGLIGALLGGFSSYTITKYQVAQLSIDIAKLEARVQNIETSQSFVTERMVRVETKIDILLNDSRK